MPVSLRRPFRLRPRDRGAPHEPFFAALDVELRAHGPARPCVVIDLDQLDHNIDLVTRSIGRVPGRGYRIVEKSLPCLELLAYVARRAGTHRLMSFHQPFLSQDAARFPSFDLLLGKPLPARAAHSFYRELRGAFDPTQQLQWLIDTPARLSEYRALARGLRTRLRISVELDIGLHRGGAVDEGELSSMLAMIEDDPDHLELAGFMGYDAFVGAVPAAFGLQARVFDRAIARYERFVAHTRRAHPSLWSPTLTLDSAGSPTYRLHERETLCNDLAVGTALLKPSHYDLPLLAEHRPAVFLAAPVLKALPRFELPVLDRASSWMAAWDPNLAATWFLYGGNWAADLVSPRGLRKSRIYAPSANHEGFHGSKAVGLAAGDHVFYRPHQVEATLGQLGDILAVRGGRIESSWPVMSG